MARSRDREAKSEEIRWNPKKRVQTIEGMLTVDLDQQLPDPAAVGASVLDQREWLRVTLSSIGDAVVTADPSGVVTFLNAAAQTMTGWSQSEAAGLPLGQIVQIISEEIGPVARNPAIRALWEGVNIELPSQSLLVARDGSERPIDESSDPIRNDAGEVAGVVVVFRDCTERRRHERKTYEALNYAEEIVATLREPFLVLDGKLRVLAANAAFYQAFHASEAETEGRYVYDIGNGQWDVPSLRILLEETVPREIAVHDFEVEHDFPQIGSRNMLLNARRFPPGGENPSLVLLSIQDITDRKRWEAALKDSELRFRRLFLTAKDGILILDAALGTIIEANPYMCGLLGYEHSDFLGKELWEIGVFRDKDANQAAYSLLLKTGYIRYEHLPLYTRSGGEVDVEFVSNLYLVGNRQVAQCNIRDISDRIRMESEARAQTTALADLHRRKDEFLAMLSHELRYPLSPILNAVHLLRLQGDENFIQQEARRIIERQVGQLAHLVDDLLEVARFNSGKIRLDPMRLDMRSIVDRAVETVRPLIDSRGHDLVIEVPDEPIWLDADPTRMEQVVVNLLNNAAKYTDEGGRIRLQAGVSGHEMTLSVKDSGIGIDLEKFPDIFDLFTQADRSLDRSRGGLGIGLSLVQRLVDMHRGTVEVQSEGLGRGSEFTIRLPLPVYRQPESPPILALPTDRPAHVGRILVVDDNVDSAEILATLLRMSGHEVKTAYNGPAALTAAGIDPPEIVLVDIGLPGINGYDVARRLRQDPRLSSIRLVAMTGYGEEADRRLAEEAGFDLHVVKPLDFRQVNQLLTTLLRAPDALG